MPGRYAVREGGERCHVVTPRTLESAGLVHPSAEAVTAELFDGSRPFFLAADKVQVKYEMLRAHVVDGKASRRPRQSTATRVRRSIL